MGMGSPDNRRKADDSCQALRVGGSMFSVLHDKHCVRRHALLRKAARKAKVAARRAWPGSLTVTRGYKGGRRESRAVAYSQARQAIGSRTHMVIEGIDPGR